MSDQLTENDRDVIDLLRQSSEMTVGQMVDSLGVTATAVRQRLNRLMAKELVSRSHSAEGRGRPMHHYELTNKGRQTAGNNFGDLAVVLWEEVQLIPDPELRRKVISGVVERLASKYGPQMEGKTTEERMRSFTRLFAERAIPVTVEHEDGLPVIKVSGCPYPTLADDNRNICDMEQRLLEKVIGHPVDLCQCQQDGDQCCSFQSAERDAQTKAI